MTQHPELLPCPFCGSPAADPWFDFEENESGGGWGEVYCTYCSASIKSRYISWPEIDEKADAITAAITAWNTRQNQS